MAYIRCGASAGGNIDNFAVTGTSGNTAGTNFEIGKYYIISFVGVGGDIGAITGADEVSRIRNTGVGTHFVYTLLVKATATTITIAGGGSPVIALLPSVITV